MIRIFFVIKICDKEVIKNKIEGDYCTIGVRTQGARADAQTWKRLTVALPVNFLVMVFAHKKLE